MFCLGKVWDKVASLSTGRDALEGRSCKWDTRKPETAVNQPSVAVDAKCFPSPPLSSLWFLFYGSILPCRVLHSFFLIVFASFSRFSPTAPLNFLSSIPATMFLENTREMGKTVAEVGWPYRWKFPWLAISVQSASHPSASLYLHPYFVDSSKVGWNSIQTNLTLARLLKPEGCLFYDRCRPPFPFYRLELSFVI